CPITVGKEKVSDGKLSMHYEGTVKVWDIETGEDVFHNLTGHTKEVVAIAFSPDGKRLISLGADGVLKSWDFSTGREIQSLKLKGVGDISPLCTAFSPDSSRVAAGSSGQKTVKVWDTNTGDVSFTFETHSELVISVAFSPDGNRLASGGGVEFPGAS